MQETRLWRIGRAAVGGLGLIFSLIYLVEGRNLAFGQMRAPGPGAFPLVVGSILALVSLWVIVDAFRNEAPGRVSLPQGDNLRRLLKVFGAFVVYVAVFKILGFVVSSVLLVTLFTRMVGEISWLKSVLCGVGVTLLIWVAFVTLLGVRLPAGVWG